MTGLYEMIMRNLRDDRLDEAVLQTEEYERAHGLAQETYTKLREQLPEELAMLLEEYTEQLYAAATIYDHQAYELGMKDLMGFLLSLVA